MLMYTQQNKKEENKVENIILNFISRISVIINFWVINLVKLQYFCLINIVFTYDPLVKWQPLYKCMLYI